MSKPLAMLGLVFVCHVANAQYETNFVVIPDKTPEITSTNWTYPSSPGTYFWNGLRTALVMGFFAGVIGAMVRHQK